MDPGNPEIAAVVVTFRRAPELRRMLTSLLSNTVVPRHVVVVDNAGDDADTASACRLDAGVGIVEYLPNPGNPGPGAGWKRGMQHALQQRDSLTHFLILDDDVVLPQDAVARLVQAIHAPRTQPGRGGGSAAPLLMDEAGRLWGFPEPADPRQRKLIRQALTPGDCLALMGAGPHEFTWCTGACYLVSRLAVEECGFHRTDFQMLGEDLEYSMRIASRFRSVFLADLVVQHLPPPPHDAAAALRGDRQKFLCLLQNLGYLAFHSPHAGHMRNYLAGNFRRWFRTHGVSPRNILAAWEVFRLGALRGEPAGRPSGVALRARLG